VIHVSKQCKLIALVLESLLIMCFV